MTHVDAMMAVVQGRRVKRSKWNGAWVFWQGGGPMFRTAFGEFVPWHSRASEVDLFARDWEVLED